MQVTAFDHVNVRTSRLQEMVDWYGDILDLNPGPRPEFDMPGAWLYLGEQPIIHLVGVEGDPIAGGDVTLEHFALRATGMDAFKAKLAERGIEPMYAKVPGLPIVQVNIADPDGNHIHIDFDVSEHDA
ncbi:MAG: glyoxalase [Boseongicola sp.]|nr:MAG: glyoxalase [Boseongicola sp.]